MVAHLGVLGLLRADLCLLRLQVRVRLRVRPLLLLLVMLLLLRMQLLHLRWRTPLRRAPCAGVPRSKESTHPLGTP